MFLMQKDIVFVLKKGGAEEGTRLVLQTYSIWVFSHTHTEMKATPSTFLFYTLPPDPMACSWAEPKSSPQAWQGLRSVGVVCVVAAVSCICLAGL